MWAAFNQGLYHCACISMKGETALSVMHACVIFLRACGIM